jgi:hypothetical protein
MYSLFSIKKTGNLPTAAAGADRRWLRKHTRMQKSLGGGLQKGSMGFPDDEETQQRQHQPLQHFPPLVVDLWFGFVLFP